MFSPTNVSARHFQIGGELAAPELGAWLKELGAELADLPAPSAPPDPFLLLTPLGLLDPAPMEAALRALGVVPRRRITFEGFARASTLLRAHRMGEFGRRRAWAFEQLWLTAYLETRAQCWLLDEVGYHALLRDKARLRSSTRQDRVRVSTASFSFETRLHAFHLPDPGDLEVEARVLGRFTAWTGIRNFRS